MSLKTGDLELRCRKLRDACFDRAMGKSGMLHTAGRLLGGVSEIISLAEEIDGSDDAEENRRLSDLYLEERAEAERLRERISELERGR
jgi:hypothetical protein